MSEPRDQTRRHVIEGLVLAFSNSRAKGLVGTDALRSVLDVRYRDLAQGGVFDLGPVWTLLEEQPGFEPDQVKPPLLRFKSWESQLGIEVKLPPLLTGLTEQERSELVSQCVVNSSDLAKVLRAIEPAGELEAAGKGKTRSGKPTRPPESTGPWNKATQTTKPKPPRRPAMELVAGMIGVFGFLFAGASVYRHCSQRPAEWTGMSASFAGDLPLDQVVRQGAQVGASLKSDDWLSRPAPERQAQLESALAKLPADVTVFFIRDHAGKVRATAQRVGTKTVVKFE